MSPLSLIPRWAYGALLAALLLAVGGWRSWTGLRLMPLVPTLRISACSAREYANYLRAGAARASAGAAAGETPALSADGLSAELLGRIGARATELAGYADAARTASAIRCRASASAALSADSGRSYVSLPR